MDFVRIKHEGIEGTGLVSERAFLRVYKEKGWELADVQPAQPASAPPADAPAEPEQPARNGTTEAWQDYAVARGMSPDQAASMGRDELVATFTTEES